MNRQTNEKLRRLIDGFCLEIETLYESVFKFYQNKLKLKTPEDGFLSEDCFTPTGVEECDPIIFRDLNGLMNIYNILCSNLPAKKINSEKDNRFDKFYELLIKSFKNILDKYTERLNLRDYAKFLKIRENANKATLVRQMILAINNIRKKILKLEHYRQKINRKYDAFSKTNQNSKAQILISYRDEGRGQGSFYDHYVFQKRTNYPTVIVKPEAMSTTDLKSAIRTNVRGLKHGNDTEGKRMPPIVDFNSEESGLLVIPGRARATEKRYTVHDMRTQFERSIIAKAKLQGRPILAICAGCWQLWESYGGNTVAVRDHCFSQMLRIVKNGDVGVNRQIHKIVVANNTILAGAMNYNPEYRSGGFAIPVNSVHWLAPDATFIPDNLEINAITIQDDDLAPNGRDGSLMRPTQYSVEAFESRFGVPVLGIQWHPEGYNKTDRENFARGHINLLKYMAEAGNAYRNKRSMLCEFKAKVPLLRAAGFFKEKSIATNHNLRSEEIREFNNTIR